MRRTWPLLALVALCLAGAGCNRTKDEAPVPPAQAPTPVPSAARPASVTAVTLGKAVAPDKKVTAPTDTFAPGDTIYASVDTQGAAAAATLTARWTYEDGQPVREETQTLALEGPSTTEFHVSKPDGWPVGSYKVEILLDGAPVRSAGFKVM